ncbi:Bacteriophage 186, CII [Comamonadaceae bacterium]
MNTKNVPTGHPKNPFEAFRQMVYGFGPEDLAKEAGMKTGTLYNKADADDATHHQPTLRDVVLCTRITNDLRVLDSLEELFGRVAIDVRPLGGSSDEALLELLAKVGQEHGDFHRALLEGLQARRFTTGAARLIEAEAYDTISALLTLVHRVKGLVDE